MRKSFLVLLALVLCAVASYGRSFKVGVLLPFGSGDAKGAKLVEFYRGVLMAVDSMANATDSEIDVYAYDCGNSAYDMGYLLALHRDSLGQADFIIGPQLATQVPALSEFCENHGVRLVVPFVSDQSLLVGHPYMYMVTAAKNSAPSHDEAATLLSNLFAKDNIVMVNTGESGVSRLIPQAIETAFRSRGVVVSSIPVEATELVVKNVMKEDVRNVVVVDGMSLESVNKTLSMLDAFMALYPDYQITMVGNQDWTGYVQHHMRNFLRYDTYIPVTHYRNAGNELVKQFENNYMNLFRVAPFNSSPHFAHMGYDVAWFFLDALHRWGNDMDKFLLQACQQQRPLQHSLYFERYEGGGYINRSARFVHYAPNGGINLISR